MVASPAEAEISGNVLYVEDDEAAAALLQLILEFKRISVSVASTGAEGVSKFRESPFDVVIIDYQLPDTQGLDVAKQLLAIDPDLPVVIVTGRGNERIAADAMAVGVMHYVIKGPMEVYTELLPSIVDNLLNIRKERRAKAALNQSVRDSEARLAAFLTHSPAEVSIKNLDGSLLYSNAAFEACTSEFEGIATLERCVLETGEIQEKEMQAVGQDGSLHHYLLKRFPVENDKGDIQCIGGLDLDISALRTAQQTASEAENKFAAVFKSTSEGIIVINGDGVIELVNPAAEQIFGFDAKELIKQNVLMLMPESERPKHQNYVKNSNIHEARIIKKSRELIGKKKDGTEFVLELNVSPLQADGEKRFVGIFRDISERRQMLQTLKRSETRLRQSQSFANIGSWDWDIVTGDLFWTEQIAPLFGYKKGTLETSFENFTAALYPDDKDAVLFAIDSCINEGSEYDIEHRVIWPDGSIRWLHERGDVIRDDAGKPLHMLGVVRDISEQKFADAALINAKLEADRANRAKSDFLSSMSHELRTPLNAISGFAQLLKANSKGPLNDDQVYEVDQIINAGNHLLELINDILDLAKIESGKIDLSIEKVDPLPLIDECLMYIENSAEQASITVINRKGDCASTLMVDRIKTKQVLLNLLSNAVKYNHRGGKVWIDSGITSIGNWRVTITNTGKGIAPEQEAELFKPFSRLGKEMTNIDGRGIGLVITKQLVTQMGGAHWG